MKKTKLISRKKSCDCFCLHEDVVADAKKNMLDEELLLEMADFYKLLSDSTRINIIALLAKNELCVCDISVLLNMTKSAISHQLQNLREMKLIKSRRHGKEVFYSLADRHVQEVFDISMEHILEGLNEKES